MGTVPLPIPIYDFHRAGHPPAFAYGQPDSCPICEADVRAGEGGAEGPCAEPGAQPPGPNRRQEREIRRQEVGLAAPARTIQFGCCFCGEAIADSDIRGLALNDADSGNFEQQFWTHLSCFADRLHSRVRSSLYVKEEDE